MKQELILKDGNYVTKSGVTIIRVSIAKRMSCKTVWVRTDEIVERDIWIYDTLTDAVNQYHKIVCGRSNRFVEADRNTINAIVKAVTEWKLS